VKLRKILRFVPFLICSLCIYLLTNEIRLIFTSNHLPSWLCKKPLMLPLSYCSKTPTWLPSTPSTFLSNQTHSPATGRAVTGEGFHLDKFLIIIVFVVYSNQHFRHVPIMCINMYVVTLCLRLCPSFRSLWAD
jgi:hypothetical protein